MKEQSFDHFVLSIFLIISIGIEKNALYLFLLLIIKKIISCSMRWPLLISTCDVAQQQGARSLQSGSCSAELLACQLQPRDLSSQLIISFKISCHTDSLCRKIQGQELWTACGSTRNCKFLILNAGSTAGSTMRHEE